MQTQDTKTEGLPVSDGRISQIRRLPAFVLASLLLGACAPAPDSSEQTESLIAARSDLSALNLVEIELTEGTNLAATLNQVTGDMILALQGQLYIQPADQLRATPLTQWYEDAWEPALSPDGNRLVYKGYRNGSFDLWQIDLSDPANLSEPEQLTDSLFDDREPQYSPDGTQIIFSSDRAGSYDIWSLDMASGELAAMAQTDAEEHSPTWSPDASQFAYVASDRTGSRIFLQNIHGKPTELYGSSSQISGLQWLPDGAALSFRALDRDPSGNAYTTLRRLDIPSSQLSDLSEEGMDVFPFRASWIDSRSAMFSADGKVKIWRRGEPSIDTREFLVDVQMDRTPYAKKQTDFDSTAARPVLGISYPAISPDGESVAFTALGDLWLWHPDSQELQQLTDDPAADQTPNWSRDGSKLAYVSDLDGVYRIQILDLNSATTSTLMLENEVVSFPSWSPDGNQLAFFTDVPANPLLHVVGQLRVHNLSSGESRPIMEPMPPQPINWSGDGRFVLTTRLVPFSQRFREGLFLPVVANIETGETEHIRPVAHRSVTHASLSMQDNALVYIQDGQLNLLPLDANLEPLMTSEDSLNPQPRVLFSELSDSPHLSAASDKLVFQSGARLMRISRDTGQVEDITPPMQWNLDVPEEQWILRAGRLFDGRSERYQTDLDIRIRGNRIVDIGPVDLSTDLRVLDASDRVVIPGIFESHAHIGDHNLSETQGRAWLAYGVTSVRDPGSNPYLANERKEAWGSGRRIGPRTFITGYNLDGNRVFYAVVEGVSSDQHLERALLRSEQLQVDFIKTYVRMSDKQQRRVVEFAHGLGIPVTSHELLPAAAYGVDGIEHFTGTSRRGYATKISELGRSYQDVVEVLAESGMSVVPTMVVPGVVLTFSEQDDIYNTAQFNAFYGPAAKQNYQSFMAFFGPGSEGYVDAYGELLTKLVQRGALVGTGTDSPFTPFGTGLHAELRLYEREGLAGHQILHAATYQSARIAGVENDLGSIEIGKLADMVVIDGDPLANISDLSRITHTIKNGRTYSLDELISLK